MSSNTSAEPSPLSWEACKDMIVDQSMLLKLASNMQASGSDGMSLQDVVKSLVSIHSDHTDAMEHNTSDILDDSFASSISSTVPSPRFGDTDLRADMDISAADHSMFSFKTPLKTFKPKEKYDNDENTMPPVVNPANSTATPPASAAAQPFIPPGATSIGAGFAMGAPDHKAQVASIKKKGSTRHAKKKAAAAASTPISFQAVPPIPPPNHSAPPDHGLDSPAASSKPSSYSRKKASAGRMGTDTPPPPPPFEFPKTFGVSSDQPTKTPQPSLVAQMGNMDIGAGVGEDVPSSRTSKPGDKAEDPSLAYIASQFSKIQFAFPPAPGPPGAATQPPQPTGFVFGSTSNAAFKTDSKPFIFGTGPTAAPAPAAETIDNRQFGAFSTVEGISKRVADMKVSGESDTVTDSSPSVCADTPPPPPEPSGAQPFVFKMGVTGGEGKVKKPAAKRRAGVGQRTPVAEAKNRGHEKSASPAPQPFPVPIPQAVPTSPLKAMEVDSGPDSPIRSQHEDAGDNNHSGSSSGDSPFKSATARVVGDEAAAGAESAEDEDAKRMLAFAELLRSHGGNLYSNKSYAGALDAYSKALDNAPRDWPARLLVMTNKAAALFALNRYPEVVEMCDATVVLCRKDHAASGDNAYGNTATVLLKVFARKGRALLKLGNYAAAHLAFAEVLDSPRINATNQFSSQPRGIQNDGDMSRAEEDAIRTDVKGGVKQVLLAKVMYNRLIMLETQSDYKQFGSTADDLLKLSPELRTAHCFKASALCKMQKWAEAKLFIEQCVCEKPESIQRLYSFHGCAVPIASIDRLIWSYDKATAKPVHKSNNFKVNVPDIVNACLAFGGQLSRLYIWALKNDKHSRFLCAETMEIVSSILTSLKIKVFGTAARAAAVEGSTNEWKWVKDDVVKLQQMIAMKNKADTRFRGGDFAEALNGYREFVKMDPEANLWNAVMYGNKAATLMRLSMYSEAVLDCHQSISRDPEYYRSYLRRARARKSLGELDAALTDYKRYLSAPQDDPGISASDRQGASSEMNEVLAAQNKHKSDEAAAAARAAKGARHGMGNAFDDEDDNDEGDYMFPHWGNGRSTTDQPKSTYRKPRPQHDEYARYGTERQGYPQRNSKKADPPKGYGYNTRASAASGDAGGKAHGPSHRHRAWENENTRSSYTVKSASAVSTHYSLLGLSQSATEKEIKTAYRQMALKYHPDKNREAGAEDMFKSVTAAYSVLSDKASRRTYDYNLRFG